MEEVEEEGHWELVPLGVAHDVEVTCFVVGREDTDIELLGEGEDEPLRLEQGVELGERVPVAVREEVLDEVKDGAELPEPDAV